VRTSVPIAPNGGKDPEVIDAAACTFLHEGRRAAVRCKCEIERAARRKRTLRASASFFGCANAANSSKEPSLPNFCNTANGCYHKRARNAHFAKNRAYRVYFVGF
jgi:hypothetical protein